MNFGHISEKKINFSEKDLHHPNFSEVKNV